MTSTNPPPKEANGVDESISTKAKNYFDRDKAYQALSSPPIVIHELVIPKDKLPTSSCWASNPSDNAYGLQMAPNVASAMLGHWLASRLGMGGASPTSATIQETSGNENVVSNVSALLLPGEATLLLGPSSSGKTTLMRTLCDAITGELDHSKGVGSTLQGKIQIGSSIDPLDPANQSLLFRSAAFVDQGDLSLTPVLTVRETLSFAVQCTQHDTTREQTEENIQTSLELVGLDHVQNTVVGNADIRGVSGGQKRRVKLLELSVGQIATTFFLDEITNGLDAASAGSLCQVLRVFVESTGSKCLACLLQPSQQVFDSFHRLILLTPDGQVAYSGPTDKALSYFQDTLGFVRPESVTIPEFLLSCAANPEKIWQGGEMIPKSIDLKTSSGLAQAFRESPLGQEVLAEIDKYMKPNKDSNSDTPPNDGLEPRGRFALSLLPEIQLLLGRGWRLVLRNPASLIRIVIAILFGAFIGTLFLDTKAGAVGTAVRSGYVLTLIFLVFLTSALAPIDDFFADRLTFYLHRKASFYRTVSYYVGQILVSMPVSQIEACFLSVLSFFAVGMSQHSWWSFFYFWAIFALLAMTGGAVARVLAYSLPTTDVAATLGSAVTLLFVLGAGNAPQYSQLPSWLKWLGWISPCAYGYESILVNELLDRNVGNLTGVEFGQVALGIPRIPYDKADLDAISSQRSLMAFDAYILIAMWVFLEICGCLCLHHSQKWYGPTTKRYQVVSGMSLSAPPDFGPGSKERETLEPDSGLEKSGTSSIPPAPPVHLTSRNIVYEVDIPIQPSEESEKPNGVADEEEQKPSHGYEDIDDAIDTHVTAREYGQLGKATAQNWVLKKQLGDDALSSRSSNGNSIRSSMAGTDLPPVEPGRLRLLSGITGSFEPGTMTALMGSSGAGKSTLLDVLAGYKTGGRISGDISINGEPKTDDVWTTVAGYCEQTDLHNPSLTVLESLVFAARMRLRPFDVEDNEKLRFADHVMELLELNNFADILVGDESSGEGLPKHARKRLTVGVELVANPSILFCDEPTSGLDGLSAKVVVDCLERATKKKNMTILCTIHQPSRSVFEAFDNLLLLRKGGICVYNGAISDIPAYLDSVPNGSKYAMPDEANPADHFLEVFCGPLGEGQDWRKQYQRSDMARAVMSKQQNCTCESCQQGSLSADAQPQAFFAELYLVFQRQILAHWRTPTYMSVRFLWTAGASILVGIVYLQSGGANRGGSVNIIGSIFFYVNIMAAPMQSAVVPLIMERAVFYRETASGTYRKTSYGLAVQLAEHPFNMVIAIVAYVIFYYMVGFDNDGEKTVYFILMTLAVSWLLPTLGQLLAFLSPNVGVAMLVGSVIMTLFTLTMGFLIPANEIPPWYIWIYWINPLRYIMEGLVSNEIGDTTEGEILLDQVGWSIDYRWFYCYFAVLMFGFVASLLILPASKISWLRR